jgi:dTDP-4-dehydrorhamnose 3,5-epimerase
MKVTPLKIDGSWIIELNKFEDSRGFFYESFREEIAKKYFGREFNIKQSNTSVSKKGSVRGIHYALVPPSQAKYVQCQWGSIVDYVIDIRVGSPTFSQFVEVELNATNPQAIFIEEGLAHAFVALEDETVVTYFVSENYNPEREKGINPFDSDLNIKWPDINLELSDKDKLAISLKEAQVQNLLPMFDDCKKYIKSLS